MNVGFGNHSSQVLPKLVQNPASPSNGCIAVFEIRIYVMFESKSLDLLIAQWLQLIDIHSHDIEESFQVKKPGILVRYLKSEAAKVTPQVRFTMLFVQNSIQKSASCSYPKTACLYNIFSPHTCQTAQCDLYMIT